MSYDIRLALMTGIDIPIPECKVIIHQPTIKEISFIGEKEYFSAIQILCVQKESILEDKALLSEFSNFKVFMMIMTDKTSMIQKKAVDSALTILFPQYSVTMTVRSLIFLPKNQEENQEPILVDDNNFEFLQNVLSQICCLNHNSMQQAGFNPQDDKAKEIADKLMKARSRIAKQKGENNDASLLSQQVSVLAIGVSAMSLEQCLNLTMYQLFDLLERYSLYAAWNLDIRVRLAGGSSNSNSEPDNWMKIIH